MKTPTEATLQRAKNTLMQLQKGREGANTFAVQTAALAFEARARVPKDPADPKWDALDDEAVKAERKNAAAQQAVLDADVAIRRAEGAVADASKADLLAQAEAKRAAAEKLDAALTREFRELLPRASGMNADLHAIMEEHDALLRQAVGNDPRAIEQAFRHGRRELFWVEVSVGDEARGASFLPEVKTAIEARRTAEHADTVRLVRRRS
jgi:hypothetical protein